MTDINPNINVETFDDLTKVKVWQEFVWKGDLYCAMGAPRLSTSHDVEIVFIHAKRRNFAMPSGWECADVLESRDTPPEAQAQMAMEILQEGLNALDVSALEQIAKHLESHRDMATKIAMTSSFTTKRQVLTSSEMDIVKMLACYCHAAINARKSKV